MYISSEPPFLVKHDGMLILVHETELFSTKSNDPPVIFFLSITHFFQAAIFSFAEMAFVRCTSRIWNLVK